jgi:hypothetical protein
MNPTAKDLQQVRRLVDGVAMSRSITVRGKPIWAWRLSPAQRRIVEVACTPGLLRIDHLDRVLDAKNAANNAVRVG